jgi:hypothetical protein
LFQQQARVERWKPWDHHAEETEWSKHDKLCKPSLSPLIL